MFRTNPASFRAVILLGIVATCAGFAIAQRDAAGPEESSTLGRNIGTPKPAEPSDVADRELDQRNTSPRRTPAAGSVSEARNLGTTRSGDTQDRGSTSSFDEQSPLLPGPSGASPAFRDLPGSSATASSTGPTITVTVPATREVVEHCRTPNGVRELTRQVTTLETRTYSVDQDLNDLKLDPPAERAVVLAITAARHSGLLEKVKLAKEDEERKEALAALRANYLAHYSIETEYRETKLAELEKKLVKLRAELKQRSDSEEKYVEAAMTIAELHADGISIQPPSLSQPAYSRRSNLELPPMIGTIDTQAFDNRTQNGLRPASSFGQAPLQSESSRPSTNSRRGLVPNPRDASPAVRTQDFALPSY